MTNEEASILINTAKAIVIRNTDCCEKVLEALDMAISAISENKGEWIYDKSINNWRCSKCGQTPPPTGYVGKADFITTHFKFCNHCGADMRGDKSE